MADLGQSHESLNTDVSITANKASIDFILPVDVSGGYYHTKVWLSTVPLILSVIIAFTVVGNVFVVIAFFRDNRIRSTVANLFILNLAITDLLVGSTVVTMYFTELIVGEWLFGETFCKILTTMDFTLTLMSTLTMLMISWDRYCLLTLGMAYKTYQTRKRIGIALSILWVACLVFYTTLAFGWKYLFGRSSIDFTVNCEMEFLTNLTATAVVNVIEFVIPFTLLLVLNVLVYNKIKGRSLRAVGQSPGDPAPGDPAVGNKIITVPIPLKRNDWEGNWPVAESSTMSKVHFNQSGVVIPNQQGTSEGCRGNTWDRHGRPPVALPENNTHEAHLLEGPRRAVGIEPRISSGDTEVMRAPTSETVAREGQQKSRPPLNKAKRVLAKHRKAAIVLTILSSCYFICYLPYNICSIIFAICKFECTNDLIWDITAYLLWCNSTINPVIYAATNVHFRRNFRHFLLLDRWSCDLRRCKMKWHHSNQDNASLADTEYDTQQ